MRFPVGTIRAGSSLGRPFPVTDFRGTGVHSAARTRSTSAQRKVTARLVRAGSLGNFMGACGRRTSWTRAGADDGPSGRSSYRLTLEPPCPAGISSPHKPLSSPYPAGGSRSSTEWGLAHKLLGNAASRRTWASGLQRRARELILLDHKPERRHTWIASSVPTIFSTDDQHGAFSRGMVVAADMESWQRVFQLMLERSRWDLGDDQVPLT